MAKPSKPKLKNQEKKQKDVDLSRLAFPEHLQENRVIDELRSTVERLQIFDSLGKTLTSSLDLSEILRLVVEKFGSLIGSKHFGLLLLDSHSNEFYYQYPPAPGRLKKSFPVGRGLVGKGLERGRGSLIQNPSKHVDFDEEIDAHILSNPSSFIQLPLLSKGSILGSIVFLTDESQDVFSEKQFRLLESFSDYMAIAIENASHHQKVQDLTITDDLTKLYNSRYLHVLLEREIARSRRYLEPLSLVFIDLDNFKTVNDTYGHIAGSNLLTEFGNFLYHQIRTSDVGIRYGGDEFVLVLPKTEKKEAIRFVSRVIEDLHGHTFLKEKQVNINITASFGIATFPEDADSIDSIIAAADRAMYQVKKSSKDGLFAANSD